jgi:hypothetical protein
MSLRKEKINKIVKESLAKKNEEEIIENEEAIEEGDDPLLAPKGKLTPEQLKARQEAKKKLYSGMDKKKDKDDMKEETDAADSLKPAARAVADPAALSSSKVGMMSGVMTVMSGMDKDQQVSFFNQVMSQYGPGKTYGVGDNSEQNKSTLDMKPSLASGGGADIKMTMPQINAKEDVEAMFNNEELTEEFKEKASVLFEAAVNAKVIAEMARLEEEYTEAITEELKVFSEELTDKLDAYLDYVVENWISENEVAIESTLRNELMEEFIGGLRNLFSEHYINVPESKIDVIESLSSRVEDLESKLDEQITENNEMKVIISEVAIKEVFDELSEGLVLTQQEKFKSLAEGIEFDGDIEVYEKKLRIIKETYFNNDKKTVSSNLQEETFEENIDENTKSVDPQVNRYVQALTRTVKN